MLSILAGKAVCCIEGVQAAPWCSCTQPWSTHIPISTQVPACLPAWSHQDNCIQVGAPASLLCAQSNSAHAYVKALQLVALSWSVCGVVMETPIRGEAAVDSVLGISLLIHYRTACQLRMINTTACCCSCRGTGREVTADERAAAAHWLMAAPVEDSLQIAYPDVYVLSDPANDSWGTQQQDKVSLIGRISSRMATQTHVASCLVIWLNMNSSSPGTAACV